MNFYERKHHEYYVTPPSVVIQIRELLGGGLAFLLLPHLPQQVYPFPLQKSSTHSTNKASRFGAINKN
jgi:hypothetical protein